MRPRSLTAALVVAAALGVTCGAARARAAELTVWAMGEEGKRLRRMADRFEAEVRGVTVRIQAIPWNAAEAKLLTAVVGEHTPDVVQLGTTYVPKFAVMGALEPLDGRLRGSAALRRDDFYPGPLAAAAVDGKLYGIPWYIDTWVLYYRTDLLAAAGFAAPPQSWAELRAAGRKLRVDRDGDGRPERYGIALSPSDGAMLAVFAAQAGGAIVDAKGRVGVRGAGFREALDYYLSLFREQIAPRSATQDTDLYRAFASGRLPMLVGGPWMLAVLDRECPEIRGRWAVAPLPRGRRASSFVGGSALAIFRRSPKKALAWRFVEFLSRPENQVRWYELSGTLPPGRRAWQHAALRRDRRAAVFGAQLQSAEPPPAIPEWEELRDKVGRDYLEKFVYGTRGVDESLPALEQELQQILAKRRRPGAQSAWLKVSVLALVGLALVGLVLFTLRRRGRGKVDPGGLDVRDVRAAFHVPYLFLLPALAVLFVFLFLPILAAFLMSLTDWNIYAISDWGRISVTGLENYRRLLWEVHESELAAVSSFWGYLAFWNYVGDPVFWRALFNTFAFVVVGVPLSIAVSLSAAIGLNETFVRGKALFRVGFFMPVVTTMVAVAVVWRWLYAPEAGLINALLGKLGIPAQEWLADPQLALPSLIVMAVWKNFGYNMIIFLAGLQGIPQMYYEAAKIDGATTLQRFRHVTWPLLGPTTYFVSIMTVIGYFQFFAEPYVMTGGGPVNSTLSIVLYMYDQGFKFYNLGYATAIAFVLFAFIALFTLGQQRVQRRMSHVV